MNEAVPDNDRTIGILLNCPFCGATAELSRPIKATMEEALEAEPYVNCSYSKCAGRHVCASLTEWQYRISKGAL